MWVPGVSGWLVVALQVQCWLRLPRPELGSRSSPGSWFAPRYLFEKDAQLIQMKMSPTWTDCWEACKASELLRDWRTSLTGAEWELTAQSSGKQALRSRLVVGTVCQEDVHCTGLWTKVWSRARFQEVGAPHPIGLAWVACLPSPSTPLHLALSCSVPRASPVSRRPWLLAGFG